MRSHDSSGHTLTLAELGTGERLFVWGFRAIAQHRRLGWQSAAVLQRAYGHFGVADAVASLDAMLETFARTAYRAVELHCPGCARMSDCEFRLLQATAAAQRGDIDLARRRFERWLPEIAADWILAPACGLAKIFAEGGLTLPARDTELVRIHDAAAKRSLRIGSPTLH